MVWDPKFCGTKMAQINTFVNLISSSPYEIRVRGGGGGAPSSRGYPPSQRPRPRLGPAARLTGTAAPPAGP